MLGWGDLKIATEVGVDPNSLENATLDNLKRVQSKKLTMPGINTPFPFTLGRRGWAEGTLTFIALNPDACTTVQKYALVKRATETLMHRWVLSAQNLMNYNLGERLLAVIPLIYAKDKVILMVLVSFFSGNNSGGILPGHPCWSSVQIRPADCIYNLEIWNKTHLKKMVWRWRLTCYEKVPIWFSVDAKSIRNAKIKN